MTNQQTWSVFALAVAASAGLAAAAYYLTREEPRRGLGRYLPDHRTKRERAIDRLLELADRD